LSQRTVVACVVGAGGTVVVVVVTVVDVEGIEPS
jgi:hypothetical protein